MFAAYKRNAAKRKAARTKATADFKQRMKQIDTDLAAKLTVIEAERIANKAAFNKTIAANTTHLKEVWSK